MAKIHGGLSLSLSHTQTCIEHNFYFLSLNILQEQIHQIEGFYSVVPQTELPVWFNHQSSKSSVDSVPSLAVKAGFTFINCLGLADDEEGKIAEISLLDMHFQPLWQRFMKVSLSLSHTQTCIEHNFYLWSLNILQEQIHQIEVFYSVVPQTELPDWFNYQSSKSSVDAVPIQQKLERNCSVSFLKSRIRRTFLLVRIQNTFMNLFVVWTWMVVLKIPP